MEEILGRVKLAVEAGQRLTKLIAAYRRLESRSDITAAAREQALERVAAAGERVPIPELRAELERWVAEERDRITAAREEFRFGFGPGLAAALAELGITPRGQLPVVRAGLFCLRVDFATDTATLYWGPEIERLAPGLALAPAAIVCAIREQQEQLRKRSIEPGRLAGLIGRAYQRLRAIETAGGDRAGSDGRVPIVAVLAELAQLIQTDSFRADPVRGRFVEYPRVQFSYDLFRLRQAARDMGADPMVPRLHVATFDSTTSRSRALWVPDNDQGDGTHYSHLSYPVRD